jgi:glycosyltransferase involved in cell wall biosynthesis
MDRRFVTLHPMPIIDPGFLNRDVGQIGQTLKNELGYNTEVWGLSVVWKEKEFILDNQFWKSLSSRFQIFVSLWKEAKNISVLHLYHIWHFTFLFALLYRLRNPQGTIYVKLDCPYSWKWDIAFIFTRLVLSVVDYIGVEDRRYLDHFISRYPYFWDKFLFTPSGAIEIDAYIWKVQKKKRLALAGRFWDPVKNYELFLDVLESGNIDFLNDYEIYFVGWYTDVFWDRVKKLQQKFWDIWPHIVLAWFLQQKSELYDILAETEIFIHTSNHEWEPNVQFDAMFCGCYVVSTDVGSISQNYPEESSIFYTINDSIALYEVLKRTIIEPSILSRHNSSFLQKYCLDNFVWKKSLEPLISKL